MLLRHDLKIGQVIYIIYIIYLHKRRDKPNQPQKIKNKLNFYQCNLGKTADFLCILIPII